MREPARASQPSSAIRARIRFGNVLRAGHMVLADNSLTSKKHWRTRDGPFNTQGSLVLCVVVAPIIAIVGRSVAQADEQ